jgi:hypothetical protein
MNPIQRFSLQAHSGPYNKWPQKTRLFFDGKATSRLVPGYQLGWQFEVAGDYLLVLDYDCPFEEQYEVLLLSPDLRIKSRASDPSAFVSVAASLMGALEVSSANLYCGYEVIDARSVRLLGCSEPPHLLIRVLEQRPWGIGALLELRVEPARSER